MAKQRAVSYDARSFLLDGKRVFLTSGSIHYFRVPKELWRDRLEKARSFGLNCIQTYVAWNVHEPREGEYVFSGDADFDAFLSLCEEMGLYVIARPGPYICAEWDFGGFPAWLLTKKGLLLRRYDPVYLKYVDRWFDRLLPIIAKHQYTRGGGVILVQVENELGIISLAEDETDAYLAYLERRVERHEIDVPLITCKGARKGLVECINTHTPADETERVRGMQPDCPLFSTEFWPGWYETWRDPAGEDRQPPEKMEYETWRFLASGGCGYNYYMWHGGTNFGFSTQYLQVTSYDYTAPLSEAGGIVKKFRVLARPARFARSFASALAGCEPAHAGRIAWREGDVVARLRSDGAARFLFLENAGDSKQQVQANLPGFSNEPLAVAPRTVRTVVSGVDIGGGFSIEECRLPVLGLFRMNKALALVVEAVEDRLRLRVPGDTQVSGDLQWVYKGGVLEIRGSLEKGKPFARADLTARDQHVILVLVAPFVDNRVWPTSNSIVIGARYARPVGAKTEVHFTPDESEAWVLSASGTKRIKPKKARLVVPKISAWKYAPADTEIRPETDDTEWLEGYRPVMRDLVGSHSGYAWYRCWVREEQGGEREIAFSAISDRALIYVNGRHVHTTTEPPENRRVHPSATLKVRLRKGRNVIAVLSDNLGHVKGDWQLADPRKDGLKMHDDQKGLVGPVYLDGQELHFWRFRDGLEGESIGRPEGKGTWQRIPGSGKNSLGWFLGEFQLSASDLRLATQAPLRVRLEGLTKGVLWVNGKNLGRYWTINGHLEYYIPTPWLGKRNSLVVFEEGAGRPGKVRLVHDRDAEITSAVKVV